MILQNNYTSFKFFRICTAYALESIIRLPAALELRSDTNMQSIPTNVCIVKRNDYNNYLYHGINIPFFSFRRLFGSDESYEANVMRETDGYVLQPYVDRNLKVSSLDYRSRYILCWFTEKNNDESYAPMP